MTSPNNTARFPYSWNEHASIFFIDQPVGVGFSYADYGESVSSTFEAGDDIAAFMAVFFEHFTQFKNRPVHMTGQSYAVCAFSSYVSRQVFKEAPSIMFAHTGSISSCICVQDIRPEHTAESCWYDPNQSLVSHDWYVNTPSLACSHLDRIPVSRKRLYRLYGHASCLLLCPVRRSHHGTYREHRVSNLSLSSYHSINAALQLMRSNEAEGATMLFLVIHPCYS